MALTKQDLDNIRQISKEVAEEVAEKNTNQLAVVVGKGFEDVQRQINDVKGTQNHQSKQLLEIVETQSDHTLRLERIENRQTAEQSMLDSHDLRIEKIERHLQFR